MAGIQKVRLNNLNTNIRNALIVGIIIAKNSPRTIGSKKKNGDSRGVTTFTLRDSDIDTINVEVWGSEYFVITFHERFLVGDVVEITSPKISVKSVENEIYRPQVSSPFYLTLNEGMSDVAIHSGDTFSLYLPLLHIPSKPAAGYYGIAEVLKLREDNNVYVDLLVVVKSVKPVKTIKTRAGVDMTVRSVEIMDNTTPAAVILDLFDIDVIQRAEEWRPLESVLFIADARVSWRRGVTVQVCSKTIVTHQPHTADAEALRLYIRNQANTTDARVSWRRGVTIQVCSKTIVTHQPHTADAEALRLYIRNQANTKGGEAAAWACWSGERSSAASVAQIRDRLATSTPFCASLHALLTHLDLDELDNVTDQNDELRVRFADHTGELNARIPISILEDSLGCSSAELKSMSPDSRAAIRWKILLEQCTAKLAASPRLLVLALRRASPADPIPLY